MDSGNREPLKSARSAQAESGFQPSLHRSLNATSRFHARKVLRKDNDHFAIIAGVNQPTNRPGTHGSWISAGQIFS